MIESQTILSYSPAVELFINGRVKVKIHGKRKHEHLHVGKILTVESIKW